jgi:hypothetical protein
VKKVMKAVAKEMAFAVVAAAIFSALFIVGHLAIYQEWPRWK